MKTNLTKIHLHGNLAEATGREIWELDVQSAKEALYAINMQTKDSIRKYFLRPQNAWGRYKILINDEEISRNSGMFDALNEFTIKRSDLRRLDIIPVLEGAGANWFDSLGTVIGFLMFSGATNPYTAMIGFMLMTLGMSNLLSEPPPMPENRQIQNPSSDPQALANSYLFSGPVNVINEGGPVPIGYGRLIVGSQVVMSSYDVAYVRVDDAGKVQ